LEYNAAVQASTDALEHLEMYILDEESDKLGTEILARRVNGKPITVEVKRVDQNFTQVAVSSGAGVDRFLDIRVSDQIHEFIRKQIRFTSSFGKNSLNRQRALNGLNRKIRFNFKDSASVWSSRGLRSGCS
jgi:predicted PP-loop superfamily ATPase